MPPSCFPDQPTVAPVIPSWLREHRAEGVLVTDSRLIVSAWNRWLEMHSGRDESEVVGNHLFDVFPELVHFGADNLYQAALAGQLVSTNASERPFLFSFASTLADAGLERMYQDAQIIPLQEDDVFTGTVTLVQDSSARIVHERQLQKQAALHATRFAVTRILAESSNLFAAIPLVLRELAAGLGWQLASLWLTNPAENTLCRAGIWADLALDDWSVGAWMQRLKQGEDIAGEVWRTGESFWISDIHDEPHVRCAASLRRFGLNAAAVVPVRNGNRILGVIELFRQDARMPGRQSRAMLEDTGCQLGQYIERMESQETLRSMRSKLEGVLASSPAVICTRLLSAGRPRLSWISENLRQLVGVDAADALNTPNWWEERVHPDDFPSTMCALEQLREKSHVCVEYRFRHWNGEWRWLRDELRLEQVEGASPTLAVGSWTDVTLRRAAEDELRASEERYRDLIENASDLIQSVAPDGRLLFVNRAWRDALGYSIDEIGSLNLFDLVHPESHETCKRALSAVDGGSLTSRMEIKVVAKDQRTLLIEGTNSFQIKDGKILAVRGVLRDVTDTRRASDELRASEERFRKLMTIAPVGVFLTDEKGSCTYVNDRWMEMTGYSLEESLGWGWMDVLHPEDRDRVITDWIAVCQSGREFALDFRYRSRTRGSVWVLGMASALTGEAGKLRGYIGCVLDITERKRGESELRRAKDAAEAASRAKSEFLANMSHEVRTPMNGIIGMTELALDTPLSHDQREYIEAVHTSAKALLQVLNDVLDFSKIEAGKLQISEVAFDPHRLFAEILLSVGPQARDKGLQLRMVVAADVPNQLNGDPGRIRQVVLNLLSNGIKFTSVGEVALEVRIAQTNLGAVELQVVVRDTGIGIPRELHERIFEAFTQADGSTTRRYGGTGLGLTICRQLVERMGGRIWVESEVGRGSTFSFTVRLNKVCSGPGRECPNETETTMASPGAKPSMESLPRSSLRILVAEDNVVNQKLALHLLNRLGHTGTLASNGREALAAWEAETFDAILMDVQMPEMDGLQATSTIRQREFNSSAHIPIIGVTAHAMNGDRERCLSAGMDAYLSKPIHAAQLADALERSLQPCKFLANPDPFDFDTLLESVGGDQHVLAELATLFESQWTGHRAAIHEAIRRGDFPRLARLAHSIGGSCGSLMSRAASEEAARLEHAAVCEDAVRATSCAGMLDREIKRLVDALRSLPIIDHRASTKANRVNNAHG